MALSLVVVEQLNIINRIKIHYLVKRGGALMTLFKLQQLGVKEDEIYGLGKILDLSRLGKECEWRNNSNGNGAYAYTNH